MSNFFAGIAEKRAAMDAWLGQHGTIKYVLNFLLTTFMGWTVFAIFLFTAYTAALASWGYSICGAVFLVLLVPLAAFGRLASGIINHNDRNPARGGADAPDQGTQNNNANTTLTLEQITTGLEALTDDEKKAVIRAAKNLLPARPDPQQRRPQNNPPARRRNY